MKIHKQMLKVHQIPAPFDFQNKSVKEIFVSCRENDVRSLQSQILWQFYLAVVPSHFVFRNTLYIFIHLQLCY